MRHQPTRLTALEARLRHSAPPLPATDHARVAKACERIASAPPVSPLREPRTFTRPLLRVAACLALLLGAALLLRTRPPPVPASPTVVINDLAALMSAPTLGNALASEADDLASDLADLTAVLNARAQAILF